MHVHRLKWKIIYQKASLPLLFQQHTSYATSSLSIASSQYLFIYVHIYLSISAYLSLFIYLFNRIDLLVKNKNKVTLKFLIFFFIFLFLFFSSPYFYFYFLFTATAHAQRKILRPWSARCTPKEEEGLGLSCWKSCIVSHPYVLIPRFETSSLDSENNTVLCDTLWYDN